jgi:hypothetical protein
VPSPSLRGLCRSWLSRPHQHGKADTNPAFTVLVTAAGNPDAVSGYCSALLSTAPAQPTPSEPGGADPIKSPRPSHPTGKPSHSQPAGH